MQAMIKRHHVPEIMDGQLRKPPQGQEGKEGDGEVASSDMRRRRPARSCETPPVPATPGVLTLPRLETSSKDGCAASTEEEL